MTLYSDPIGIGSHRVRLVLAEKGMLINIIQVTNQNLIPDSLRNSLDHVELPILINRELILYNTRIISEYLDERFPHPPLLPVYPIERARYRLMIHELEHEWLDVAEQILKTKNELSRRKLRKELTERIVESAPFFTQHDYFLGDEFSLVDCCLAPLLYRLPILGIELPEEAAKNIRRYLEKVMRRNTFQTSLSDEERDFRGK